MKIRKLNNNILTDKQVSQITSKLNKEFKNVVYYDYSIKAHCFNQDFITTSQKTISTLARNYNCLYFYQHLELAFVKLSSNGSILRNISKNELYNSLKCFGLIKVDSENYFEI